MFRSVEHSEGFKQTGTLFFFFFFFTQLLVISGKTNIAHELVSFRCGAAHGAVNGAAPQTRRFQVQTLWLAWAFLCGVYMFSCLGGALPLTVQTQSGWVVTLNLPQSCGWHGRYTDLLWFGVSYVRRGKLQFRVPYDQMSFRCRVDGLCCSSTLTGTIWGGSGIWSGCIQGVSGMPIQRWTWTGRDWETAAPQ